MAASSGPAGRRRRARTPDPAEIAAALERREAAKRAKRGRALDRAEFLSGGRPDVDRRELSEAVARVVAAGGPARAGRRPRNSARRFAAPLAFPAGDVRRWVPIGPSVVRRGQAEGRPRVTGRIRDLAVDATGRRAYAATAKGGVWYTRDGGSTWDPLGGWTSGNRGAAGGLNTPHACGTVMVAFDPGGDETLDLVMVGTGEPPGNAPNESVPVHAGVGVFAARGPAGAAAGVEPWEAETGLALMAGLGIFRLARDPAAVPGKTANPNRDRVVAATSRGLFLGTRTHVPAMGPAPAHDEYRWVALTTGLATLFGAAATPQITDVLWLPGGANGILVVAHRATATTPQGVAVSTNVSTDAATTFTAVGFGANPPDPRTRTSLANAAGTNRVYILGEQTIGGTATPDVWQIPSVAVAAPAATAVGGIPLNLWPNQRDYDQAIAVDVVGGNDRIYVGGSVVVPAAGGEWSASLWAFQTPVPPAVPALAPVPSVSGIGAPPAGDGADQAGLIGNNVHGDVHAIRITGPAAARQVWIGCDGGIFRSDTAGRVNTFQPRHTGLAALEVGFHAPHPTSSHFGAIGCQDNGTQVRVGDTVWEETFVGDGGGVAFHPTRSQYVITQWTSGSWFAQPATGFFAPMVRQQGGGVVTNPLVAGPYDPEDANSAFYSGGATIARTASESRFAIGTDRVWLCDDIGVAAGSTWRVIGFPNGPGSDQAAASSAPTWVGRPQQVGPPAVGAPAFLGPVIRLRWASPTVLLALYQRGIVRYVQTGANWAATILSPGTPGEPTFAARNELFTDIATLPMVGGVASNDFYLVTTGNTGNTATDTCFFYDSTVPQFVATNLRRQLDPAPPPPVPGPLDPAFAVAVDPTSPTDVYVGTVTGVWHATRGAGNVHAWDVGPMANGLPEATVQDLTIWHDAADAASPRLLRAAVQSRGVWEVDLAAANEARRTYVRVHERDDRRRHPTPMANPRRRPGAPAEPSFASPDIVVRPRWPLAAAPTWRLPAAGSMAGPADRGYQLWTFQTAFRWLYPSIVADGNWSDQLADLVELHRTAVVPVLPAGRQIDQALWNVVVGTTTLNVAGQVNAAAGDPLAVYRPPWHHAGAPAAPATEIDVLETVLPVETRLGGSVWRVYREPITVDVLLHHRDTRPLPVNDAFAIVLWRSAATQAAALAGNVSGFVAYARSLLTGAPQADPAGWNVAVVGGSRVHRLNQVLDARLPKAVSVDIDLTAPAVPDWHRVLIVAIAGSTTDALTAVPAGPITTPESLVRNWPHAAMRLVQVRGARPV